MGKKKLLNSEATLSLDASSQSNIDFPVHLLEDSDVSTSSGGDPSDFRTLQQEIDSIPEKTSFSRRRERLKKKKTDCISEAVVDDVASPSHTPQRNQRRRLLIIDSPEHTDSQDEDCFSKCENIKNESTRKMPVKEESEHFGKNRSCLTKRGSILMEKTAAEHQIQCSLETTPTKRKRGRPPKRNADSLQAVVDKVKTAAPTLATNQGRRRRLILQSELDTPDQSRLSNLKKLKGKTVLEGPIHMQDQDCPKIKGEPDSLSEDINFTTISSLKESHRQWRIKVRVMRKGTVENFKNGKGSLQRLLLMDTQGVLIQAVMFNEVMQAIGKDIIKGETCFISNGTVKSVNKSYINVHESLELSFNAATHIERAKIPIQRTILQYQFVEFSDLHIYVNKNKAIDIIAYLVEVHPLKEVRMGNTMLPQRVVTLSDLKSDQVKLTMWADLAIEEGEQLLDHVHTKPIVAISMAKVTIAPEGTIALSSLSMTTVEIDPQVLPIKHMEQWVSKGIDEVERRYIKPPDSSNFTVVTLTDLLERDIVNAKNTYFYLKATIRSIEKPRDPWYNACNKCNKKVITSSKVTCPVCGDTDIQYRPRYALKLDIGDGNHTARITLFDAAQKLLGCSVEDFITNQEQNNSDALLQILVGEEYSFLVKMDKKNDITYSCNNFVAYDVEVTR